MAPNSGAQCWFNKFDCRLFVSKFSQFAFYLSLPLLVISKSLAQLCCKYCNHSVGVVWNAWFATNGMYVKTTSIYKCRKHAEIEWARRGISIVACCHSVKLCILAAWVFQSQQSGALTRMWRWCRVQQKECAIGAVHSKKERTLLQPLSWCCVESAIQHKWDVRNEQHTNICDVNKQ